MLFVRNANGSHNPAESMAQSGNDRQMFMVTFDETFRYLAHIEHAGFEAQAFDILHQQRITAVMGQRLVQLAVYLPILLGAGIRRRQQRVDALFNRVKRRRWHPPCGQAGGFRLQRAPHVQRFDKFADSRTL